MSTRAGRSSTRTAAVWTLAALGGLAALTTPWTSDARPDDVAAFLGSFETSGRYSNRRKTKAEIEIVQASDGALTITRTGRYTSRRHRRKPAFTWTSKEVQLEGGKLRAIFRLAPDGSSLTPTNGGDLVSALTGAPPADPSAVDVAGVNVLMAEYRLEDDRLREEVENTTRRGAERWWRKVSTKGPKVTGPAADPVVAGRVRLGHDLEVSDGRYTVILPTDGTLTLTVAAGALRLEDPSGAPAAVTTSTGARLVLDLPHTQPTLGTYTAVVEGVSGKTTLSATFVQRGKIDERIRPWSSHTYYPINEFSHGTSPNENTMFVADGPLEKFDRALGLTGRESATWWEKGTDYRTGFGFEHGHYTKAKSPTEKKAEAEWYADLDGDGVIETEGAAAALKRYDADADGKITREEAKDRFEAGVIDSLWASYDDDQDGKIGGSEISSAFVSTHDKDASTDIDPTEWAAALRREYASLLESRSGPGLTRFMKRDADGDGAVVEAELADVGAVDFQDSSDVDGDFNSFFDRDNVKIVTKAGETHFGNKVVEEGGKLKLFKGRKKDELVVELDAADVEERTDLVADGDLDDSYSVGWWGHCNAWSMAAIVFRKPQGDITRDGVTLSVRDQKGLLVEFGMGDTEDSTFWWQQWGGDEVPPVKYTAGFHRQLHTWLRVNQKGMMADMDLKDPHNQLNFQVWNYPLLGYEATLEEVEGGDPYVFDVSCKLEKGSYSDEDSSSSATVSYRLHFSADGAIREDDEAKTDWTQKSGDKREYIRYLMHPFRFSATTGSRNPKVTLERLEQLFGDALKYNRLEDLAAEDDAAGGLSGTEPPTATTGTATTGN